MAISTNQKPTIYRNLYENTQSDFMKHQSAKHQVQGSWNLLILIVYTILVHESVTEYASNFHPLEVVDRGSETQLQVGENLNPITKHLKG